MSRKQTKPLVDLNAEGATFEDVVAAAQGKPIQVMLESGMRFERVGKTNTLKTTCTARLFVKSTSPGGRQIYVPLCMPMVGETWSEVLEPLGKILDQEQWTDIGVATVAHG